MTNFDVASRTIYLTKHGSHAYGTNTPSSDLDIKGICVPPEKFYTGFTFNFDQEEKMAHSGHPNDQVTYGIKKFFKLAADCNPNIIEVLHVRDESIIEMDEFGKILRQNAVNFLSKKARFTFSGFAHEQLRRIQTHRRWLLNPCDKKPTREEFGLAPFKDGEKQQLEAGFAQVQKKLDEWNIDMMGMENSEKIHLRRRMSEMFAAMGFSKDQMWLAAAGATFNDQNLIRILQVEKQYSNAQSDHQKYLDWKFNRNPERAELEAKFGYDTKHGGHLIRLQRMCCEILGEQGVIVFRPDAQEILQIRRGEWSYEKLIDESKKLEEKCEELYRSSMLRHKPDMNFLNDLCSEITKNYHRKYG